MFHGFHGVREAKKPPAAVKALINAVIVVAERAGALALIRGVASAAAAVR